MDKAVVRMYFEDQTFKSFLILPKTTATDLVTQVQTKLRTPGKNYWLVWSDTGEAEKYFAPTDAPWEIYKQHGDKVKFLFKTSGPSDSASSSGGPPRGGVPMPGITPAGRGAPPPAPAQRTPTPAAPTVTEDDFDQLLNQLTDIDVGGGSNTQSSEFDLDLNFGSNLPVCSACGEAVKSDLMTAFGLQWHKQHLACAICRRNFLENDVPVVEGSDGNAYCEQDYLEKFAPKCGRCQKPIQGQCTNALGKQWHPQCFTCASCNQPFKGTFFEHDGNAYCELHYYGEMGLVCPTCEKPIIGKCVKARGQRFHPQHFQCSHCATKLAGSEYFFHNDKLYCKNCSIIFYG
eukprot:TRINITY_DN1037_c0_g1_i1.p1 TRINITY_DN1037_c0_g1~~TRINITY_DN1037_c0_g1_i1.p1  ORF type:complete len:346 (-),score=65.37 TRINITY_DN1037_c0_g1_i1:105-1142(-)